LSVADAADLLDDAGRIVQALEGLGFTPILVGGMALVTLGSRRVTRDFDFVITHPGDRLDEIVDRFYDAGLELAARLNTEGDITATITARRVAAARLRIDAPATAYFLNAATGLRIDLLFDFPIPAETLARTVTKLKMRSVTFHVASEPDLLRLKKIARAGRDAAGDAEDIAFLQRRRKKE
jgi:hypothetical protein